MYSSFAVVVGLLGCTVFCEAQNNYPPPRVKTTSGTVIGFTERDDRSGRLHHVFLGIPYAQPPVGPLRWKAPVPALSSNAVFKATKPGNVCPQQAVSAGLEVQLPMGENCLNLNIMVPASLSHRSSKTPVLFIIHGGAFSTGGGQHDYPYKGVIRNLASRGLLVVTINYRLGALGFLRDTASKTAGTFGILDQLEALRWVQRNIGAFGGDPRRVTVYGESAGSISVSLLTMMPAADDLFQQVFQHSNSLLTPATTTVFANSAVIERSKQFARKFRCHQQRSYFDCLRSTPWQRLVEQEEDGHDVSFLFSDDGLPSGEPQFDLVWSPLVDANWMRRRLRNRPPRPTLAGVNRDEMTLWLLLALFNRGYLTYDHYSRGSLAKHAPGLLALYNQQHNSSLLPLAVELYSQSLSPGRSRSDSLSWLEQTVKMYSDAYFVAPLYLDAAAATRRGAPAYLFSLDFASPALTTLLPYPMVPHLIDVDYMLADFSSSAFFSHGDATPGDRQVAELYGQMTANFVKTGRPSLARSATRQRGVRRQASGLPHWPPLRVVSGGRVDSTYMSLLPKPMVKEDFHPNAVNFWARTVAEL